jgi:hypothetical protein
MGEDQITAKIRAELERGITSESQAVYLLVETRKLLDRDRMKGVLPDDFRPYESLRLFTDWAVHVCLSGPRAQNIVKKADAYYPKMINGTLSHEEKADFARTFALNTFRHELSQFLQAKNLPPFSDAQWNFFLKSFLNVIEDCPLFCKAEGAAVAEVDEVVLIRQTEKAPDGNAPALIWALCFQGKLKFPVGKMDPLLDKMWDAIVAFGEARER